MTNENFNEEIESQTGFQDSGSGAGEGFQDSSTKYGISKFDDLPIEERNQIMSDYISALKRGWDIKDAEVITREYHQGRSALKTKEKIKDEEVFDDKKEEFTQEKDNNMIKLTKLILVPSIIAAILWVIFSNVFLTSPIDDAISKRTKAANDYFKSHSKRIEIDKIDDLNKAAYESAYKKESCMIYGNCIKN